MDRLLLVSARSRSRQLTQLALAERFEPHQIPQAAGWRVARAHDVSELSALLGFAAQPFEAALIEPGPELDGAAIVELITKQLGRIPIINLGPPVPGPTVRPLPDPLDVSIPATLRALKGRPRIHLVDPRAERREELLAQIDVWQLSVSSSEATGPRHGEGVVAFALPLQAPPLRLGMNAMIAYYGAGQAPDTHPGIHLPEDPATWPPLLRPASAPLRPRRMPVEPARARSGARVRRRSCELQVCCQAPGEAPHPTHSVDISRGGIAVALPDPPAVGTTLSIDISLPEGPPVRAHAEIAWQGDGQAGLRFTEIEAHALSRVLRAAGLLDRLRHSLV